MRTPARCGNPPVGRAPSLGSLLPALLLAALLAGCGTQAPLTGDRPGGGYLAGYPSYKVGPPYEINGIWYYPAVDYNYDRTGVASWYGARFQEKYTANGEVFDLNGLTAAHTTLPLPSVVQVTNLENGRSLRLRVNDRGPFVGSRIIDVTRRAAQLLGFESEGTARVRVKVLKRASLNVAELAKVHQGGGIGEGEVQLAAASAPIVAAPPPQPPAAPRPAPPPSAPPPPTPPPPAAPPPMLASEPLPPAPIVAVAETTLRPEPAAAVTVPHAALVSTHRIFIQAGAFAVRDNAWRVRARIAPLGSVEVLAASVNGIEVYRVRLGPFASLEAADALLARVVDRGYPGARIVTD